MSAMFRSLSLHNYRVWFIGALVSNAGHWMQTTAQSWVVLTQLTDNDAGAVGVTMALQFAPPLLLVPVTGWVADRFDRRKLLLVTQTTLALLATVIGVLLLLGAMTLPLMWVFAGTIGVVSAFDIPARQAFVSDLVTRENMSNAVALNSASFNMARMVGPALAGILIVAVGTGWVFLINAATFGAMIIALLLIRTHELTPRAPSDTSNRLSEGFRYVAGRPDLIMIFVLVFVVGSLGMNFPIIASTMAVEFERGADGFGLLNSVLAIGSLAGALLAARRSEARIGVVIWAAGLFAATATVSAFMPIYWMYAATLVFTGFAVVTLLTTANALVQTTTTPALRGRVLALYVAVMLGGTPIGAPIIGWATGQWGPRFAILLGAVAAAAVFGAGLIWLTVSRRARPVEDHRLELALDGTRPLDARPQQQHSDEIAANTLHRPPSGPAVTPGGKLARRARPRAPWHVRKTRPPTSAPATADD